MTRYSIEDITLTALGDAVRSQVGETRKEPVPILHTYTKTLASKAKTPVEVNIIECAQMKFKLVNGSNLDKITGGHFFGRNGSLVNFTFYENETFINYDDISKAYTYFTLNIANTSEESCEVTIEASGIDVNGNVTTELVEVPNVLTPIQMAEKINNLPPAPSESALTINDNCIYKFAYNGWNWFIQQYGDKIITKDITNADHMFYCSSTLDEIPFDLNFKPSAASVNIAFIFGDCHNLKSIPKLNGLKPSNGENMLSSCYNLRELDYESIKDIDWSYIENLTSGYYGSRAGTFSNCYSLRSFPMEFLNHTNPVVTYSYSIYYQSFSYCCSLDSIGDLPVIPASWTSNAFANTFAHCYRLCHFTFAPYEGSVNWSKQTIDLTTCGYISNSYNKSYVLNYNSGITADKEIKDDNTYRALKSDPDKFTCSASYSRYDGSSAIKTLRSLPTTTGTGCTIKFKGSAGSASVVGDAINAIPETYIAEAAAKGWTVTFV